MDKHRIAEWILSSVFPADRATAAAGDFTEDAAGRGRFWFWSCVFRTTIWRAWNDLVESPLQLAGLALRAWVYGICLFVGLLLCLSVFVILMVPMILVVGWLTSAMPPLPAVPAAARAILSGLGSVASMAAMCCFVFRIGRWIGRRAKGKEMAACIALCLVQQLLSGIVAILVFHFWGSDIERLTANQPAAYLSAWDYVVGNFVFPVCIFVGALRTRFKSQASTIR